MEDPAEVVLAYVAAYYGWNEMANQRFRGLDVAVVLEVMEDAARLLGPYFAPGCYVRSGSCGYPSQHQPQREVVQSIQTDGERSLVTTRLTQYFGTTVFELDYEYHLSRHTGPWLIERIVGPPDGGRLVSSEQRHHIDPRGIEAIERILDKMARENNSHGPEQGTPADRPRE